MWVNLAKSELRIDAFSNVNCLTIVCAKIRLICVKICFKIFSLGLNDYLIIINVIDNGIVMELVELVEPDEIWYYFISRYSWSKVYHKDSLIASD